MTVALVTGAGQGIGRAIALRLARDGFAVAVNDIDARTAADTAEAARGRALACAADVADPRAVEAMVARVSGELGPPTVLVNNAAAMTMAPLERLTSEEWHRVLRTNLDGAFHCVRAVVPGMIAAGRGRIVTMASDWGLRGAPGASHYAASKGGLVALTRALARELGPHGITANAIAPGPVDTSQLEVDARYAGVGIAELRAAYARESAIGRVGRPEEIAATVAYLVSELAGCVTGQVLSPTGGGGAGVPRDVESDNGERRADVGPGRAGSGAAGRVRAQGHRAAPRGVSR